MTAHEPVMKRPFAIGQTDLAVYGNAFRAKRLGPFLALVDAVLERKPVCHVLDVGGERPYWDQLADVWQGRALEITIVNIGAPEWSDGVFTQVAGDARDMSAFADDSFDVIHSNSVIEHVGRWQDMRAMAREVRRLAPSYFVQTPNFWFPYEPHLRTPFIHWMPLPWRRAILSRRACGFYPRARDVDHAYEMLADASLIDAAGMKALFPDARLVRERIGPLTKSFVAIRDGRAPT